MSAIFSFDETYDVEDTMTPMPRRPSQNFVLLNDDIESPKRSDKSPSKLTLQLAKLRLSPVEDEDTVTDLPTNPISITGTGSPSRSNQDTPGYSRLGTSYEVGIDETYVSSFADIPGRRKMVPEDFEPLKVLGQGAYGKVLLVREKATGRLYAQKQLKKASMIVEQKKILQTKSERSILESVKHPYIVRLFYALQDHHKLYLLLEYAQGGELFTHLASERMFSEDVTAFYVAEMTLALNHLHSNVGVVYRDLKPENCLLDSEGHLVLTDFGLSKVAEDGSTCNSLLGTPEYMAPEILQGKEYDYAVDWWSLGAVCYDLLTGSPPFTGNNHKMIIDKVTKSKLNLPYYLSADAKDLLTRLLRKDPNRRLGYKDIVVIKNHRFFRKIDWKKLEVRDPQVIPPIVPVITDPILAENFSSEFTDMVLSPDNRQSIPVPCTGVDPHAFQGFSYTASQSFIDSVM
jgi:serine/threonine protein kinase